MLSNSGLQSPTKHAYFSSYYTTNYTHPLKWYIIDAIYSYKNHVSCLRCSDVEFTPTLSARRFPFMSAPAAPLIPNPRRHGWSDCNQGPVTWSLLPFPPTLTQPNSNTEPQAPTVDGIAEGRTSTIGKEPILWLNCCAVESEDLLPLDPCPQSSVPLPKLNFHPWPWSRYWSLVRAIGAQSATVEL